MSNIKLGSRYAKSLLDLAVEQGKLEDVNRDIRLFNEYIRVSRDFSVMLKNPIIHAEKKLRVMEKLLSGKITEITMTFIRLLVKKRREAYLADIAHAFVEQYNEYKHITPVLLKTAFKMDQSQIDKILDKVKKEANLETIELTTEVDESLIGGFVLQYQDKLFDSSIFRNIRLVRSGLQDNEYVKKLR